LEDEDFGAADVFADLDAALVVLEFIDERAAEAGLHPLSYFTGQLWIRISAEEQRLVDHDFSPTERGDRSLATTGGTIVRVPYMRTAFPG
jgi:hypothetical protein